MRQGCLLPPTLFNVYAKITVNEVLETVKGLNGERRPKIINFADDRALIAADSAENLSRMLMKINNTANKYEMKINIEKKLKQRSLERRCRNLKSN